MTNELRSICGTESPRKICECMKIPVVRCELPEKTNAFLYSNGEGYAIIVNTSLQEDMIDYCIAHELGHMMLHGAVNALFLSESTYMSLGKYEREADLFAAFLILGNEIDISSGSVTIDSLSSESGLPREVTKLWVENCLCGIEVQI